MVVALLAATQLMAQDAVLSWADKRDGWLKKSTESIPELKKQNIKPVAIVRSVADKSAFQGWRMEPTGESVEVLYKESFKPRKEVILDLGDHYTGYFSFKLFDMNMPTDAPVRFKLTFAEVPGELNTPFDPLPVGSLSRAWLQDEIITVMRMPAEVKVERRLACRYVKIELLAESYYDFVFADFNFQAQTSATGTAPELAEGTAPIIKKINDIGLKTLAECMQTVYEDGPKRDQRLWVGDLYLEALANAYSYKNHTLTRRCLYLLAGMTPDNGFLRGTVYEHLLERPDMGLHVMDYSLLYGVALYEYFKETGDKETADELWPVVKHQVEFARNYLKNNVFDVEMQPQYWLVFDWKDELNRHAPMQGLMTFAIEQCYELAKMLGREAEVADWPKLLKDMRKASRERFYDKKLGVMKSGPDAQISYLSQVWMILSGTLDKKEAVKALEYVLADDTACYIGSPYAYHYLIEAMIQCGMEERAREMLITYWGDMVNKGADTFWEVYDPNDDYKSPYKFHPMNSYCHAWSCTPVYFIHKYKALFQR
ncbi:MAG: glycoside hydrolase [Alistipes sp.]|nr:glycoside hydrolase [Alistipes sp.]